MSLLDILIRLGIALFCGALIGVERQYRQHDAGLRTSALVAAGSALFVLVSALTTNESSPTRVAGQVVTGVGFLCAGVILRDGLHVRGLTTAGTLWCASGVGVLAGSGFYLPALAGTCVVLAANLLLRPLAQFISNHSKEPAEAPIHYRLFISCLSQQEIQIRSLLLQSLTGSAITLRALQSRREPQDPTRVEVCAHLQSAGRQDALLEQMVARLSLEDCVSAVRWEIEQEDEAGRMTLLTPAALKERKPPAEPGR